MQADRLPHYLDNDAQPCVKKPLMMPYRGCSQTPKARPGQTVRPTRATQKPSSPSIHCKKMSHLKLAALEHFFRTKSSSFSI
jgi:hypothetical protein